MKSVADSLMSIIMLCRFVYIDTAMIRYISILLLSLFSFVMPVCTFAENEAAEEEKAKIDPKSIIFEHLGDGYGWEVPFNHHKRFPLPVIVIGTDGLHVFSSARVTHGQVYKDGDATFMIAGKDSDHHGKIV